MSDSARLTATSRAASLLKGRSSMLGLSAGTGSSSVSSGKCSRRSGASKASRRARAPTTSTRPCCRRCRADVRRRVSSRTSGLRVLLRTMQAEAAGRWLHCARGSVSGPRCTALAHWQLHAGAGANQLLVPAASCQPMRSPSMRPPHHRSTHRSPRHRCPSPHEDSHRTRTASESKHGRAARARAHRRRTGHCRAR